MQQSQNITETFDFTHETQKLRQVKFGLRSETVCLDESSSSHSTPGNSSRSTLPQCSCGEEIDVDSSETGNGAPICSGSILEYWQEGVVQFPLGRDPNTGERRYVGLILPRARPRSQVLLSSLLKSRNKLHTTNLGKSRLPPDVDVNRFSPKIGEFAKKFKLDETTTGRTKESAQTKFQSSLSDEGNTQGTRGGTEDPNGRRKDRRRRPLNQQLISEDFCPYFPVPPHYLGRNGEPFIQTARRGFLMFTQEFGSGVHLFDSTPGAQLDPNKNVYFEQLPYSLAEAGREGAKMFYQCRQQGIVLTDDGHWTPFNSVDILPQVMQTLQMDLPRPGKANENEDKIAKDGMKVVGEIGDNRHSSPTLRVEKFAQTEAPEFKAETCPPICHRCWNKTNAANDVGVGTHSDEEADPETSQTTTPVKITCKVGTDDATNLKSPPRPKGPVFSIPLSTPRLTPNTNLSSYSSHFCNSKSSLGRPDATATVPVFTSLETFPPLSSTPSINTYNQLNHENVRNDAQSSASSSLPIPVTSKPRIPSLMDLKITLPTNPSTSNAAAIVITKRKGRPRLPTIADAIQHSMLNSPTSRSSKLSNNVKKASGNNCTAAAELKAICLRNEAEGNKEFEEGFPSLMELGLDLPLESSSAWITEEQEQIRRNANLLYSWPLDDDNDKPAGSQNMDASISSDESPASSSPWTANSVDSHRSSIPDIEDSNNNLTPKVLKISNGSESQYQPHRGINSLFQLLAPASQQPPLQNSLAPRVHVKRFIEDWKETKASLVCLDSEGRAEHKRISSIQQN